MDLNPAVHLDLHGPVHRENFFTFTKFLQPLTLYRRAVTFEVLSKLKGAEMEGHLTSTSTVSSVPVEVYCPNNYSAGISISKR